MKPLLLLVDLRITHTRLTSLSFCRTLLFLVLSPTSSYWPWKDCCVALQCKSWRTKSTLKITLESPLYFIIISALLCSWGSYEQRWVSLTRIAWPAWPGIQMANVLSPVAREASSTSVWVSFTAHTLSCQCPHALSIAYTNLCKYTVPSHTQKTHVKDVHCYYIKHCQCQYSSVYL